MLQQRPRDDVAIVAVGLAHNRHWTFDANDAMRAQGARSSFVAYLRAHGQPNADFDAAELIFGELTGNVVRYAPGPIDIDLEWVERRAVLHVIDHGPGFEARARLPDDEYSEHGRGLFIISTLGREFSSTPLCGGGSHVRVALPVTRP
jgi:anti-sigma regulatory factor (Ser/Thr protein kinase)